MGAQLTPGARGSGVYMCHTLGTAATLLQPDVAMCAQIGQVLPREPDCWVALLLSV